MTDLYMYWCVRAAMTRLLSISFLLGVPWAYSFSFSSRNQVDNTHRSVSSSHEIAEVYGMPSQWVSGRKHNLQNVDEYRWMYQRSIDDPHEFWTDVAAGFEWRGKVCYLSFFFLSLFTIRIC